MDPKSDINDMGRVLGLGGSMDKYTETLTERQYEPGTVWQYVSIDTHVAAMALREVTGKTLHQLWEETYGEYLGMGKAPFYLTDGKDVAFALGGLNLRTRDYAKFGQLFLQGGEWEGEQLVPVDWVKNSTVNHAPNVHPVRGSGYGYQWWVPMPQAGPSQGDFFAVGIYGQYIYVNPAMNIVIAKNAADREFTQPQSNGQHSMNMNIDMFRSLAEQLSKKLVMRNELTLSSYCLVQANLELTPATLPDGMNVMDFIAPEVDKMVEAAGRLVLNLEDRAYFENVQNLAQIELMKIFSDQVDWKTYEPSGIESKIRQTFEECKASGVWPN